MSSTALRAVRELRGGDDGRPFTPRGERPGTASAAMRAATPDDASAAGTVEALRKELEETKLALEKEKRNSRALEQYLTELTETKDNEIRDALAEAKVHQQALARAEAHATNIEDTYKAQAHKLTMTLEKLTQQASAGQPASKAEMDASFAAVLRDEMRTMSAAFTAKLAKATADASARHSESAKLIRTLQEQILETKRNNSALVDKIARAPAAATTDVAAAVAPGTGPIFAATAAARAQSGATGASAAVASKPAPAAGAASSSAALMGKPAAAASSSAVSAAAANGASSSRTAAPTSAASSVPAGTKPVVKSSTLKTK